MFYAEFYIKFNSEFYINFHTKIYAKTIFSFIKNSSKERGCNGYT